jgi:hypothetical protein
MVRVGAWEARPGADAPKGFLEEAVGRAGAVAESGLGRRKLDHWSRVRRGSNARGSKRPPVASSQSCAAGNQQAVPQSLE